MTRTLWDIEASLARAALGNPYDVHREWLAGTFTLSITSDIAVAIVAACFLWIDRGNKPLNDNRASLMRLGRLSLQARDAWFDDGYFIDVTEEMWISPFWGPSHLARAVSPLGNSSRTGPAWRAALAEWKQFKPAELT